MTDQLHKSLWQQFGAAIDMLTQAITECPDDYLATNRRFYYLAYHAAMFLDYYSSLPPESFSPMLPFTVQPPELRPKDSIGDLIPDKIYTKEELLGYLKVTRAKCKSLVASLAGEGGLDARFKEGDEEGDMDYSVLEIILYNMRHIAHHVGQLNLQVRQDLDKHMGWEFRADL